MTRENNSILNNTKLSYYNEYVTKRLIARNYRSHYGVYDEAKGINATLILRPYRLLVTVDYVEIQEPEETNSEPNEKKNMNLNQKTKLRNSEKSSNYNDKNDDTDLYRRNLDSLTGKTINVEINDDILKNKCSLLKFYMGDEANYTTDKDPFSKENIEKRKKRKIITIIEYFHRGIAFIAMIAFFACICFKAENYIIPLFFVAFVLSLLIFCKPNRRRFI
ncbi:hypothetical protein MKS88_005249 [Plasmodium brasilianum]|uniref:Uncharacterized protein n=1 Tax=Plasmodium brasilianum TaxID=5824 RepID=A0ACB9Y211_PLABR|nr:hypothetical protein MKS88_005249 [Plasmodium brasilianum]